MDWKKEIKLSDLVGRKRAPTPPAEKPVPFWKKEISFRRKPKAGAVELGPVAEEDWVREQLALAAAAAAAPAPLPPAEGIHSPVPASELPPLPKEKRPKQSLLKKEFSFGRKPKAEKLPSEPKEKKPKKSLLKKEISFARNAKAEKPPKEPKAPRPRGAKQLAAARKAPKRLVGLKIGASQLPAARVANNGRAELLPVAPEPPEPRVVVGRELRDPEALAVALKAFFRKHRLPRRGVRLGIANNRIGVRTLDVVGISDPKQLANAIRFRAQEALPIPIDEAVLDYRILSEAETIKRSLSLADGPAPEGLTEEEATAAREAIRRQVQTFARELVSSLQFYQGQPGSLGIGEIVLTGGTAHLGGLADDLERLIGVRVRVGDPLARVRVGKRVRDPEPVGSLAVAIGLGIED